MINGDKYMINDLKSIRKQTGLSQREFAKRIGKTGAYVSMVEAGKIKPSADTLATVEAMFGNIAANTSIGERLKQARKKRDYTQGELARTVGCNRNTISSAENGKTSPSIQLVQKIAEKLWISEDWLRFGIGNMERSEIVAEVLETIRSNADVRSAVEMYLKWNQDSNKE